MNRRGFFRLLGLAAAAIPVGKVLASAPDEPLAWGEGMSPSEMNNSARAMMADLAKERWSKEVEGPIRWVGGEPAYLTADGFYMGPAE